MTKYLYTTVLLLCVLKVQVIFPQESRGRFSKSDSSYKNLNTFVGIVKNQDWQNLDKRESWNKLKDVQTKGQRDLDMRCILSATTLSTLCNRDVTYRCDLPFSGYGEQGKDHYSQWIFQHGKESWTFNVLHTLTLFSIIILMII